MTRFRWFAAVCVATMIVSGGLAAAESSKEYIKQLSSPDPEVRANAAYELGCG